jgi:hypothetical protein
MLCIFTKRCSSFLLTEDFILCTSFSCKHTILLISLNFIEISSNFLAFGDFFRPNFSFFCFNTNGWGEG